MKRILNINNFLKINENNKKFREVDIQQLWYDFMKYKKQLSIFINTEHWTTLRCYDEFIKHILYPIFEDKEVEFHRNKNRFDYETTYNFYGRIKDIMIKTDNNQILVLVNLYENKDTLILATLNFFDNSSFKDEKNNISKIVKVHNSDITTIELEFNILNDVNKYNL